MCTLTSAERLSVTNDPDVGMIVGAVLGVFGLVIVLGGAALLFRNRSKPATKTIPATKHSEATELHNANVMGKAPTNATVP